MIGNNDWLDYMEYRDYIAHSMGMWDKSKIKYKEKIPVGGGKFRYIYDEPNRNRNASRRSVPTYFDKNQRDAERRNAERSSYSRRTDTDRRVEARNRVRGVENSRRSMENNALTNRQSTNLNVYQRQQRAGYDAQRRAAEQHGMQNRAANDQQIEANKLARGYVNQQRVAEQQMAQNRMNSDARMAQRQQTARADAERRDMEQRTAQGRAQNEQDVANKPKNLFDHMGRALGNAANAVGSALNSAGDWVGDRARDVQNAASGAWNNVTGGDGRLDLEDVARSASPITDAARSAGQWMGDTARNVGDWVDQNITGNTARNNASKAYEDERHYKQLADDAHNSAQNHFTDYQQTGNPDSRESAGIMADWAINDRLNAKDAGQRGDYYQQQADRSLFGRVGNAANAAGQWLGDRVSEAAGAAKNLYDQAGNAIGGVGDWIGDRAADTRDAVSGVVDTAGRRLGSAYDQMTGRENGSTWSTVTGGDNHFNYGDVGNLASAAGREAQNVGRAVGQMTSNAVASARSLIETTGGNIAQALSLAQQRLRYAQNTGNPQMERDAQEVIRTLESPSFNFKDRATMNTRLYENQIPETILEEERIPETILEEERLRNRR